MKISEFKKSAVFDTRIEINEEGDYITLREPTMAEIQKIQTEGEEKVIENLSRILPDCIIDSSFEADDGGKATGKQVAEVLKASSTLMSEVVNSWAQSLPFQSRLPKKAK